ncbi:MAG: hypothetical protein MZV70_62000 [Desulfobacterales bacterium]|nr:hypothetical protein [Desulfobacterales bacterium]
MTTPGGRRGRKKKFMQIIAAHRMPYATNRLHIGHPHDLMAKIKKAKETKGTKFIHTLTPCPTGWRMPEDLSAKAAMLAVETKLFPLYEIIDGTEYRITHQPQGLPVSEYIKIQGRVPPLHRRGCCCPSAGSRRRVGTACSDDKGCRL